jgi:hypothetical protein
MKVDDITPGMWVRVHTVGPTTGMLINPKNLALRREGAVGVVRGYVPGHGGDVWWVEHRDNAGSEVEVSAYVFHEIEQIEQPARSPITGSILD